MWNARRFSAAKNSESQQNGGSASAPPCQMKRDIKQACRTCSGFDFRQHHRHNAPVCSAHDRRQSAAAALQCSRHAHCRSFSRFRRVGSRWLVLYADDLSHLYPSGALHGQRSIFSIRYGEKDFSRLRAGIFASFTLIAALTFVINAAVFLWIDPIMRLLSVPVSVYGLMREYLWVIFFVSLPSLQFLRLFAARAVGNSCGTFDFSRSRRY